VVGTKGARAVEAVDQRRDVESSKPNADDMQAAGATLGLRARCAGERVIRRADLRLRDQPLALLVKPEARLRTTRRTLSACSSFFTASKVAGVVNVHRSRAAAERAGALTRP